MQNLEPELICWELSVLNQASVELRGPLPAEYVSSLQKLCTNRDGVYIAGIQVGDARRFAVPSSNHADFPTIYNPVVVNQYDYVYENEGCLSFPGLWVPIRRFKYVELSYRDQNWDEKRAIFGSEGDWRKDTASLLSKALQHEVAHMEGICLHQRIRSPKWQIRARVQVLRERKAWREVLGRTQRMNLAPPAELESVPGA